MSFGELKKNGAFCPNFKICIGCFVHLRLFGVGGYVHVYQNGWGLGCMSVGCFVCIPIIKANYKVFFFS